MEMQKLKTDVLFFLEVCLDHFIFYHLLKGLDSQLLKIVQVFAFILG